MIVVINFEFDFEFKCRIGSTADIRTYTKPAGTADPGRGWMGG